MRKRGKKFAAARAQVAVDRSYTIEEAIPLVQKGKLGKVLGPRGLMPNPKTGTVTVDIAKAVREIKAGKVEFRVDKTGIVHAPVGKTSFATDSLVANTHALVESIVKAKPPAAKGKFLRSVTLSSTMGPGIKIDTTHMDVAVKH